MSTIIMPSRGGQARYTVAVLFTPRPETAASPCRSDRAVECVGEQDLQLPGDLVEEAIVAPVTATTCDVDTAILAGHSFIDPPFALGHECVARVVETGDAVTVVRPGDLVVVPWSINCGSCENCRAGLTAHCTAVPHMTMYGAPIGGSWGGLFSDLVRVP